MKTKTLLFGAGDGSKIYMSNNRHQREFIGLVDNDIHKKGKIIHGLPVYSPSDISGLDYAEIVITTQWALEVEYQLLNDLKLPRSKVIMPPKNQLKKHTPFFHEATRELGRYIITTFFKLANKNKVNLVVDFGTLLGIVRDNDIIMWDDDIDMSIKGEDFDKVCDLIKTFIEFDKHECKWVTKQTFDNAGNGVSIVLSFTDPQNELIEFKTSFSVRVNQDGKSVHKPSLGMWYSPQIHFSTRESIEWQNTKIHVPNKYTDYLTFVYGDWRKPKKDIQITDYANTQVVSFSDFQKAGFNSEIW